MLKNYVQIALRNLLKNKLHTVINIFGLAAGMACVLLITLYVRHELSYDQFHTRAEDLYRITWVDDHPQTRTPHPMAQAMVADFPEVENAVSLTPLWASGLTRETHSLRNPDRDQRFDEQNVLAVDTTFFDVFSFPLVRGDKQGLKKVSGGIYLSESMARKYFGDDDPLGKHLAIDSANYLADILGVFRDVPENSHFHFDFLISYVREKHMDPLDRFYSWGDFGHYNYLLLKPGTDTKALEGKMLEWAMRHVQVSDETVATIRAKNYGFNLQPVTDIHLKSKLHWELEPNGNIEYIYILASAALFTLLIACVNFMNLSTAKSAERAKEIGVRKTMGAFRIQLTTQFLTESIASALAAVVLSTLIVEIALPLFNTLTGTRIVIDYTAYLVAATSVAIFIGAVAGVYPALYLSAIRPLAVLKGNYVQSAGGSRFRNTLIVLQFSISMILITSSIIAFNQLTFLQNKDLGFSRDAVIVVPLKNEDGIWHLDAMRTEMERIPGVQSVTATSNVPGKQFNQHSISLQTAPQHRINASEVYVDHAFFKTLGIDIRAGRTFLKDNTADDDAFVINEMAARQLGLSGTVTGKELVWHRNHDDVRGGIIGIVGDFHFQSLHEPIRPLIFKVAHRTFNYLLIKSSTDKFEDKIAAIQDVYKTFEPTFGFEYSFLDDQLDSLYHSEQRTTGVLAVFSVVALVIAAFGLFGMSMMLFYQKSREVSIRKVLGATRGHLLVLLVGDFTKLVVIAIFLGGPVAWYVMDLWLNNFTYRSAISLWSCLASAGLLIGVAWATLGYFTLKATRLNPAETLKTE